MNHPPFVEDDLVVRANTAGDELTGRVVRCYRVAVDGRCRWVVEVVDEHENTRRWYADKCRQITPEDY